MVVVLHTFTKTYKAKIFRECPYVFLFSFVFCFVGDVSKPEKYNFFIIVAVIRLIKKMKIYITINIIN